MPAATRLSIIGDDPELTRLEAAVKKASIPYTKAKDLDEACEGHELEAADVFVIGPSLYFQSHLNQIQKLEPQPEILLVAGKKLPNLAKILVPNLAGADWPEEELLWQIEHTAGLQRRKRRLVALRDHHSKSSSLETNPAINLVTNLMRKCTMAEQAPDLLSAMLSLRSVVDYYDSALVTLGHDGEILEAWSCSRDFRDAITQINLNGLAGSRSLAGIHDSEVQTFSSSAPDASRWEPFLSHPWSFGMAMRFSMQELPRPSKSARSGVVLLYRRELLPFLERDQWLLELTYGPLALALEKVAMLKAISQASKEWRSTFDGISEPLSVIDSTYTIVKANKAFARLVDQDIKKLKGKRCYTLLAGRRGPCSSCPVGMATQPQVGTRVQLQGKARKDLLVWSYGIRTGLESYHFQFYRNVSKETALASTLIQSEKMAALGKLVGAIAHEINNPLAGILATSQLLLEEGRQGSLDAQILDDIEEIRSAAWRSKKIIDDLLGFTSEAKNLEEVNLLDAVRAALTFSKSALKEIAVKVHSEKVAPRAFVSENSLQQVLFNLITNAAQAMNGKGALEISIEKEGANYRIDVRDNGPGLPAEKLKHVFDPFYTSKQEGTGTGLGLSIVRSLIQKMNARIEVSSSSSKGTEFRIFLPIENTGGK
jgi:two-component system, NtrC family, sensor kinase